MQLELIRCWGGVEAMFIHDSHSCLHRSIPLRVHRKGNLKMEIVRDYLIVNSIMSAVGLIGLGALRVVRSLHRSETEPVAVTEGR
jgi:hypothetical protein